MQFIDTGLSQQLVDLVKKNLKYDSTTSIQEKVIPTILSGKDIMFQSQTGTGKTAAFLLPLVDKMLCSSDHNTIVLSPTREIAIQTYTVHQSLNCGLKVSCVYGGAPYKQQLDSLKTNNRLVIGTVGRILDLVDRKVLNLERYSSIVLDEMDVMLDMGFLDEVIKIVRSIQKGGQVVMCSATCTESIKKLAYSIRSDISIVKTASSDTSRSNITQYYQFSSNKQAALLNVIETFSKDDSSYIVFTNTKQCAEEIASLLKSFEFNTRILHSGLTQSIRNSVIVEMQRGAIKGVVCTDVLARGIDIHNIDLVINYEAPSRLDTYTHRIGRTGRMEREGLAFTVLSHTHKDKIILKQLQRITNNSLKPYEADSNDMLIGTSKHLMRKISTCPLDALSKKYSRVLSSVMENVNQETLILYMLDKLLGHHPIFKVAERKYPSSRDTHTKKFTQEKSRGDRDDSNQYTYSITQGREHGLDSKAVFIAIINGHRDINKSDIGRIRVLKDKTLISLSKNIQLNDIVINRKKLVLKHTTC